MQPRVILKRSRAIDEMALRLLEESQIQATASSENNSPDPVSITSSIQLPSLEELTGGPACADEPTLQSLLNDLDEFSFSSTNCETDVFEQTMEGAILPCDSFVKSTFVDHFLPNDCAVEDIPNVEAQTQQPDKISNKEANLSCTRIVQDGPKKTEEVELIHVPCDAACGTKVVAEAAAVEIPPPPPPPLPFAIPTEELVLQTVSLFNCAEKDIGCPKITSTKSKLPLNPNQTAKISSQLSSSDSSEEDDAIHFYVSDEDNFFNV